MNQHPTKTADVNQLTFEVALQELEKIVSQLERGDVALEDSIRIYERGAALKSRCSHLLQEAQLKVEQIVLQKDKMPTAEPANFE